MIHQVAPSISYSAFNEIIFVLVVVFLRRYCSTLCGE